jgi:glucose-1-phosphate thymidylyltransferase
LADTLKIVIPMAGWGTRMRPHTWSKPKPLISVAGRTSLDHLLDMFKTLPISLNAEYVFIVGPHLGERQIPAYIAEHYPRLAAHFLLQTVMKGQSHALWLAREFLNGAVLVVYSDTLIETDFAFLSSEKSDGVAWVKPVSDPRRFGVAEVDDSGRVTRLVEKPSTVDNNLALVGCYYFNKGVGLVSAIEEQMQRGVQLKGEYFLVDAINILLERGASIRTEKVSIWLDTGTIDATLETNSYLLQRLDVQTVNIPGLKVISPVFIHPGSDISNSVIGPNVSIGSGCRIMNCKIDDSILETGVQASDVFLSHSLIGNQVIIQGRGMNDQPVTLNIGDNSSVSL